MGKCHSCISKKIKNGSLFCKKIKGDCIQIYAEKCKGNFHLVDSNYSIKVIIP